MLLALYTCLLCFGQLLQGSDVPSLLLSTESGLHIYHGCNASVKTLYSKPGCPVPCITSLAYRAHSRDIFFISNGHIWFHVTEWYVDPMMILRNASAASELVVDWVDYKLYFLNDSQLLKTDFLGINVSTVELASNNLSHLTIEPYEKLLFYVEDGTLKFADIVNSQAHDSAMNFLGEVTRLVLDHHRHLLYVITVTRSPDGDLWSLVQVEYTREMVRKRRIVFKGAELERATALVVMGDRVMWTSISHYDELHLYVCKVYLCSSAFLEKIRLPFQVVMDLKLSIAKGQSAHSCSQMHCPDFCTELSPYTFQCVCPPGKTFDDFNNMCVEESVATWEEMIDSATRRLRQSLRVWVDGLAPRLTTLILCCCVLMLLILEVGMCLLPCTKKQSTKPADTHCKLSLEIITEL